MIISTLILIVFIISFLGAFFYTKNLRKKMIFMFLEKNILTKVDYHNWYSSATIHFASKKLNKLKKHQLKPIFDDIKNKKFSSLINFINSDELKIICGKKISINQNLFLAEKYCREFKFNKAQKILNKIPSKNKQEKARIVFLEAQIALYEGDLEQASIKAALAINQFRKLHFIYEEALAYLLCGTVYRASAVFDTAQFMLKTAANLFNEIGAKNLEAVTFANIGMILTAENRNDEANDTFDKALNIFEKNKNLNGMGEVLNQKALAALINLDFSKAQKLIKSAENLLSSSNIQLRALNFDIAAQIAAAQNKYSKTISLSQMAADLYKKTGNNSALLEMMYLQANTLIKQNKLEKADLVLRNILKKAKSTSSSFHIANIYNLLGIICMKRGEIQRAIGLFNQSLSRELCNERWVGAAIDYANIALAELKRKNTSEADSCFLKALKYAEESGNKQLVDLLKKLFNPQ